MKRSLSVLLSFAGAIALASCSDPTGDLGRGDPTDIGASPSTLVVNLAATKTVTLQLFDKQGNPLPGAFSAAASDPTVVGVEVDTSFRPGLGGNTLAARYIITALAADSSSVVFSSRGVSKTVPVVVNPTGTAAALLATTTALVGDTVAVDVAATGYQGVLFDVSSIVTFGTDTAKVVAVTNGGRTLTFVPQPGSTGPATISTPLAYASNIAVTLTTTNSIAVSGAGSYPVVLGATNLNAGDTLRITATAPFAFDATSRAVSAVTGHTLVYVGVSANGDTLKSIVGPSFGADTIRVTNAIVKTVPTLGYYTLSSSNTLTTPAVTSYTATFSSATPARGDTVTVTAGANFRFLPTATISFGTTPAIIISRAADSTSIRFVPVPGSTSGPATANGVVLSFLTSVSLNIPSNTSITVPTPYAGTNTTGTSPTLAVPAAAGQSSLYVDGGAFPGADITGDGGIGARYYRVTLASAATLTLTASWSNTADIDIVVCDDAVCTNGNFAAATGAKPETASYSLAAGTWYIALVHWAGTAPTYTTLNIAR